MDLLKSMISWCWEVHSRSPIRELFYDNNAKEVKEKFAKLQPEFEKLKDAKEKLNAEEEASVKEMLAQALKETRPVENENSGGPGGSGKVRPLVLGAGGKLFL